MSLHLIPLVPVADFRAGGAPRAAVARDVGERLGEGLGAVRVADEERVEREALALDGVVRAMDNRRARRVIIVPHRIVNVVV